MTEPKHRLLFKDKMYLVPDPHGVVDGLALLVTEQVVFPGIITPLTIRGDINRTLLHFLKRNKRPIIVIPQHPDETQPLVDQLPLMGVEALLADIPNLDSDPIIGLAQGQRRVEVLFTLEAAPIIQVTAEIIGDEDDNDELRATQSALQDMFRAAVETREGIPQLVVDHILSDYFTPGEFCDVVASTLPFSFEDRLSVFQARDLKKRLEIVAIHLAAFLTEQETRDDVSNRLQDEIARTQREMYLREQMRVIQGELGEGDIFQQELDDLYDRILQANLPQEPQDKAIKEWSRLTAVPPMSPESGVIRTYLDWLVDLPWHETTDDNLDLANAEKSLNTGHYGLPKVKDRILEHIAVHKLAREDMKSPILCFVGPPGVGKTSLGKSIAETLGRKFIRVSLGGVRDEAEIRGHRRTYIGALPGRILQMMRKAETLNPVFMLDEIDKLTTDYHGDPASALLEVLDPEQNSEFTDHYLEVPYDLSQVLFIATANDLYPIPEALEDRMEVIEFPGYTEEEKITIARQFLIPKQLKANGIANNKIRFETTALQTIIRHYTYEAGVRNLEREIANVCRKLARLIASGKDYPKRITSKRVQTYLGPPQFLGSRANPKDSVGIVTGLVWTSGGGDIQTIEIALLPGKGNITMTGQLGDVLQESAQTAFSYLRSRANDYHIPHDDFDNYDVHVHMPEGAVPKDGPSAGITLAIAFLSAFTEAKVRSDYAMTGEMTLHGQVLPVGGILEKVLSARRHRIHNVILPHDNKKDLVDIPPEVLDDMNIIFVKNMKQVIKTMLHKPPKQRQRDLDKKDEPTDETL